MKEMILLLANLIIWGNVIGQVADTIFGVAFLDPQKHCLCSNESRLDVSNDLISQLLSR